MIAFSMTYPARDLEAVQAQIERLTGVCMYSDKKAVRIATIMICKALRSSTKQSRRVRKITAVLSKRKREKFVNQGALPFYVHSYDRKTDAEKKTVIFAASKDEASRNPIAKIRYAGLAKMSWGWAMRDLFNEPIGSAPFARPRDAVSATATDTAIGYAAKIINRIDYIEHAFTSKGRAPVTTAMNRAANSMRKFVEREIEKAKRK